MRRTWIALSAALMMALAVASPSARADGGGGRGMSNAPANGGGSNVNPAESYQNGVAAMNARNYRDAIRHFRTARRALPNDPNINYALGLAYVGNEENDEAREAFERAARSETAHAGTWLQLGLVYLELGQRDQAAAQVTTLERMISECDATCGDTRRGQLQAARDQLARALEAPAGAPAADSGVTGWHFPSVDQGRADYAEAVGLINQERFVEALDVLSRVQSAVGPHPDVLNYMGFASRKLGRFDAALAYYDEALRIDPAHLGATEYLGELYIQMGQVERARSQLARLDRLCAYGCAQRDELARWIETAE